MQTKCIWYVQKKEKKHEQRVYFETYELSMHYSFSPRDPISLQGPLSFSGHSQQPAHTNFLLIPTNRTQPCGPSTWTKNPPGNMPEKREQRLQTREVAKAPEPAKEAKGNQAQNLNLY